MASNTFGNVFRITTWGESHGKAIGVVIDGCPAGLALSESDLQAALSRRAPGQNAYTTPRQESDRAEIYSGVFRGQTTGAPISIIIANEDGDPRAYEPIQNLLRPGHANGTYLAKYGVFDHRGGGRASARETAVRVAAGAVAQKLLTRSDVHCLAYLDSVGKLQNTFQWSTESVDVFKKNIALSPIFCPDPDVSEAMMGHLLAIKATGDSVGGVVGFVATGVPIGLGDPIYEKLEANLARAMMSVPASKGFEIGEGFAAASMLGSEHNDLFVSAHQKLETRTNHAGGILGGIATGMPIWGRVAFKPTSSIQNVQMTVDVSGEPAEFQLPEGSRHDPCVAIRAVPVVEAMCALVLTDAMLMNRLVKLS